MAGIIHASQHAAYVRGPAPTKLVIARKASSLIETICWQTRKRCTTLALPSVESLFLSGLTSVLVIQFSTHTTHACTKRPLPFSSVRLRGLQVGSGHSVVFVATGLRQPPSVGSMHTQFKVHGSTHENEKVYLNFSLASRARPKCCGLVRQPRLFASCLIDRRTFRT